LVPAGEPRGAAGDRHQPGSLLRDRPGPVGLGPGQHGELQEARLIHAGCRA
ncbi:hypothetical protein G0U57_001619, partial [Chelydra serpentina]